MLIIDETLTLLKARGYASIALDLGALLFCGHLADIIPIIEEDIQNSWKIFRQFDDKDWSFTDCASKAVMQRLGITTGFSFDRHFHQFGVVHIVPVVP